VAFCFLQPVYPIADSLPLVQAILAGGAKLVQLRAKDLPTGELVALARAAQACAESAGALLIIDDRADVAQLTGAAGVHLGQDDLPPAAARAILGPDKVIGFSTHNIGQVEAALANRAIDYVAFGPIFPTTSKRDPSPVQGLSALAEVRARCPLPLVAIGGITASTLADVLAAGADAVAMIGAIVSAADPTQATRTLLAAVTTRRSRLRS
jgi:thiamine-phosphate pyrophosphorylase